VANLRCPNVIGKDKELDIQKKELLKDAIRNALNI
jgi:hypothetical protein